MKTNLIQGNYQVFKGDYNAQMPLLVKQGFNPLTAKDIMEYRIKAIQSKDKDEIKFWLNQYWDTVDGIAYFKNNLIIVPNSQELLNINKDSKLNQGSLILTQEQYDKLAKEHDTLKRNKIVSDQSLTKKQAKQHPIWLRLAQEDKALLNEYVDSIFAKAKEVYDNDENMGIYLLNDQETPVMCGWYLWGLDNMSDADAGGYLDDNDNRLLGVHAKNLDELLLNILKERKILNPNELKQALDFYKRKDELIKLVTQLDGRIKG